MFRNVAIAKTEPIFSVAIIFIVMFVGLSSATFAFNKFLGGDFLIHLDHFSHWADFFFSGIPEMYSNGAFQQPVFLD